MTNSSSPSLPSVDAKSGAAAIVSLCRSAADGDLEPRVQLDFEDAWMGEVAESLNHLLDTIDVFVRESTAGLRAAGEGRYYRRILEQGLPGTFRFGARRLNAAMSEMAKQGEELKRIEDGRVQTVRELEEALSHSAERISDAVKAIGDITRGTRILALNAKIEAARAGDAGKGFAIVADEVEKTSDKVAKAMAEVDRLFVEFRTDTQSVLRGLAEDGFAKAA